ncbi:hypothetical protein HYPSUDRAFT_235242 [Hypholoma sublateritium FD-334 SS-4]|uniref:Uncharacterized protein n=1 Tax=Hypholoma sublateritium (strain FD-334 SS-4) TaxID=945553 RepID=A0A0D2PG60_HYPSF|nr:hypothetical protein HYPSUDRAFT_235242 [Hypholoma sublateritium FD-334 SS-4]
MNTTPTRAPRTCRVCSGSMRGSSHERCRLQEDARWYQWRGRVVEEDVKSESSNATETSHTTGLNTPPPSPTASLASIRTSGASSTRTSASEKAVRRQLAPPPPVYPRTIISEASFEIPETGAYHRVNPNFRAQQVPTAPSSEAGSDVATEIDVKYYPVDRPPSPGPSARGFMRDGTPGSDTSVKTVRAAREDSNAPAPGNAVLGRYVPFNLEGQRYDYFDDPPVVTKYEAFVAILEPTRARISAVINTFLPDKNLQVVVLFVVFFSLWLLKEVAVAYAKKQLEL